MVMLGNDHGKKKSGAGTWWVPDAALIRELLGKLGGLRLCAALSPFFPTDKITFTETLKIQGLHALPRMGYRVQGGDRAPPGKGSRSQRK